MTVSVSRNYRNERIQMECAFLSPAFLGGADQQAALSVAPLKAALRYWWRVSGIHQASNADELFDKESALFGNAEEGVGKSQIRVSIQSKTVEVKTDRLPSGGPPIPHPEVNFRGNSTVNSIAYLGGMGILAPDGNPRKSYLNVSGRFQCSVAYPERLAGQIVPALGLFKEFGTVGSRSRNAFGSLDVNFKIASTRSVGVLTDWGDLFGQDYPHGLGKDNQGLLGWESRETFDRWNVAFHALAEAYINLRTRANPIFAFPTQRHSHQEPTNRHLLGYPVTNHSVDAVGWKSNGRHASALRFAIKPDKNHPSQLRIVVLHIPHAYSNEMMNENNGWPIRRQQEVWSKVHEYFDQHATFQRLTLEGWK